jgi:hypothetical protein
MIDPSEPARFNQSNILQPNELFYFLTPFNRLFQGISPHPLGLTGYSDPLIDCTSNKRVELDERRCVVDKKGDNQPTIERWTARRKADLVVQFIKGRKTIVDAAREYDLKQSEIQK